MKRFGGIVLIIAVAFAALYGLNRWSWRAQEGQELPLPKEEVAQRHHEKSSETEFAAGPVGQPLGDPKAKVRVVAVVPMGVACHMQTMQILQEIAKADPKRVRVEFYDMHSPQGQKELAKHNIHCATVLVNGKFEWKVKRNGKEQTVVCQRKPNEPMSTYNSTDLIEIVHQELQRQYGKGFEPVVLQRLRAKGRQILGIPGATALPEEPSSAKAKVVVEVLAPSRQASIYTLFANTVEALQPLKKRYGEALAIRVYSLMTREGQDRLRALNLSGPAVVINGKTVHELEEPGKGKRQIVTAFGSSSLQFSPEDVKKVVLALLEKRP